LIKRSFQCVSGGILVAGALLISARTAPAQPVPENVRPHAGMLRYPAISAKQIVFVYADQLWLVPREGGLAVPVANPPGAVSHPHFSPDGKTIAFTGNYDGLRNLYTIPIEGGVPKRVTHHPHGETLWNWTPDGKLLFSTSAQSDLARQAQLYVVGPNGGLPTRLPVPYGEDAMISPDGRWLAYTPSSTLNRTWKRYRGGWASDIWLFDLQEKKSKRMTDWEGNDAVPMWVGNKVYYLSDNGPEHRLNIWRYDTKSSQRQQVTHLADYDVKWPSVGPGPRGDGEIVFQHGADLDLLDVASGKMHAVEVRVPGDRSALRPRLVDVSKFVESIGISPTGKRVAIEARGDIWTAPAKEGSPRNLTHTSGVAERSPAWSPDGRWIAYFSDAGGEYELTIAQSDGKAAPRQLTRGSHTFYSNPNWSPDSKQIAYADKSGTITLCTVADGKTKVVDRDSNARPVDVSWSPDNRWLAYAKSAESFVGNTSIWIYNVETGQKRQVTGGMFSDGSPVFDHKGDYLYFASSRSFNPTYDDQGQTWIYAGTQVLLAAPLRADIASPYLPKSDEESFTDDKSKSSPKTPEKAAGAGGAPASVGIVLETASPASATEPIAADGDEVSGVWTGMAGGVTAKFTLMLGAGNSVTGSIETSQGNGSLSGAYDPGKKELNLNIVIPGAPAVTFTGVISGATLTGTVNIGGQVVPITLNRVGGAAPQSGGVPAKAGGDAAKSGADVAKPIKVTIDFEGFEGRAMQLPVKPGRFGKLAVNDRNQLLFVRISAPGSEDGSGIKLFDITDEKTEEKSVAAAAFNFDITPDGKKIAIPRGTSATIQDASVGASGENVVTSGMMTTIEPRAEWKQIFTDAWRMERDYFYDPNMHGVNWTAVRDQYAKMLDDCNNRDDVGYVISEMISELNVGHAYYGGGDTPPQPGISVGMLGVDYELHEGAYRIAKIYSGAPWDVDARGPLSQPGVKVKAGDYLLAVNGVPLDTKQDPWAAFQGMANHVVTLTFSAKPTLDAGARDIPIRLIGDETQLRYRAWIERNRAYIAQKTGGRVGYVYVPSTGVDGQNDLVRQYMAQLDKAAIIIDERWNSGGQIPDRFIELLNRPATNYWALRDGNDWTWPPVSHQGPKCMLINGESGSGGDAFPWYFRQAKLGKLIGTRTWGGLVGLSGNPGLIDGAGVTVPAFGFYKPNGTWAVEGHGVDPDIEIIADPALMQNGGDPQLDRAIQQMLDELKQHPYTPPKKPTYPNRSGMGVDPKDR
jgi:tricorn protease